LDTIQIAVSIRDDSCVTKLHFIGTGTCDEVSQLDSQNGNTRSRNLPGEALPAFTIASCLTRS
jgi:hypothetical protein